jgi:hypothetical protein
MRPIRSASWILAAAVCAGAAGPAAAQESADGKTVDELLDIVRKAIGAREGGARAGQDYGRFHDQKEREFAQRAAPAAAVWDKEPNSRRTKLGKAILDARVRRAFGDFNQCNKVLQAAYRKAQNPLQKQLAAIELAKMFQLRGNRKEALTWIGISQREVKDPKSRGWLKEEGAKVAKMSLRLKEYKELLEQREANPRDPAIQLRLCEHLRSFADGGPRFLQGGNARDLPFLLVELYVNYEWMRTAFPSHPTVVAGGIDSFMLDQAIAARDHVTAAQVATRLLRNTQNGRAKSGQLVQDMAVALERDESRRGQALLCWRTLQARYPDYPSVKGGQAEQRVREMSKESKLRSFAKAELPPIPWK